MLAKCPPIAFAPTTDPARAERFYSGTLGLTLLGRDPFALTYDAAGTMLRVATVPAPLTPQPFTILGWSVPAIAATVRSLAAKGVTFQRYPGVEQDELGVWTSPSGARVAWLLDPDGNTLSLTQLPDRHG